MTIQTLNTFAYGVVALLLIESALRNRPLTIANLAVGLHMLIVTMRSGLLEWWPSSAGWEWATIHRLTIIFAMLAALFDIMEHRSGADG